MPEAPEPGHFHSGPASWAGQDLWGPSPAWPLGFLVSLTPLPPPLNFRLWVSRQWGVCCCSRVSPLWSLGPLDGQLWDRGTATWPKLSACSSGHPHGLPLSARGPQGPWPQPDPNPALESLSLPGPEQPLLPAGLWPLCLAQHRGTDLGLTPGQGSALLGWPNPVLPWPSSS